MKDEITLLGMFPECQSKKCPLRKECANHCTAGDFRMEDGGTPELHRFPDAKGDQWECTETFTNETLGALTLKDGELHPIDLQEDIV